MSACWLCNGDGVWDNQIDEQTNFCPICCPMEASCQSLSKYTMPTWCREWPTMRAKYMGPLFQVEPDLLVVHSGSKAARVAEFFHETGYVMTKGGRKIKVSAHINWSTTHDGFAQSVPLNTVAWHCGGSRLDGKGRLNFRSIGIELPGPWNSIRPREQLDKVKTLVEILLQKLPSLKTVVRHSDIDKRKKDPGCSLDFLEGLGFDIPFN